jgi:hypothetical protein
VNWSAVGGVVLILSLLSDAHGQGARSDVREYVRDPLRFGASYRQLAEAYDPTVVPELVSLLNSEAEEDNWLRITGLLGVIGDEQAVEALIAFLEKPLESPKLSPEHQEAYRQAIMSLGLIVNRTGSDRALRYLVDGLTPSVWRQRRVPGMAPWQSSYEERDRLLSHYALFGLAMSGDPRAGEALRSLQHNPTPGQAEFRIGLDSTLAQWLELYELVAEKGVAGMYEHYEAKRAAEGARLEQEAERRRAEAQTQREEAMRRRSEAE